MTNDATDADIIAWGMSLRAPGGYPRYKFAGGNVIVRKDSGEEYTLTPNEALAKMREEWDREHGKWTGARVLSEARERLSLPGLCSMSHTDVFALVADYESQIVELRNRPAPDVEACAREIVSGYMTQNGPLTEYMVAAILRKHLGADRE